MPKFVILGSCRHEPYEILAMPNKIPGLWNTEEGYQKACDKFYPAIKQADIVLVYNPDGLGEHTRRDIEFAREQGKKVCIIVHESCLNEKNELIEEFRQFSMEQKAEIERLKSLVTEKKPEA